MVIWVKFTHSSLFISLIPKMSVSTLAISCVTTSNLPWFMDLAFQVPMQYCSLQHRTLLPSSITSTTECYFCFVSVSSFFLDLFIHWSPVAFWSSISSVPTWGVHLSVSYHFAFSCCSCGSQGKNTCLELLPVPSPVDHVLTELFNMTHLFWVALHGMAHSLIVRQGFVPCDQSG